MTETNTLDNDLAKTTFGDNGVSPFGTAGSGSSGGGETGAKNAFARWFLLELGAYLLFFIYFGITNVHNGSIATFRTDVLWRNVVTVTGLAAILLAYRRAFTLLKEHPAIGVLRTTIFAVILAVVAVCIPNFYSTDLFSYVNPGWQQAHYHVNPYVTLIAGTPGYGT
ncbi:MAG: hypothetical protein ACRD3W_13885, partial [Terriglobales bacterium]